MHTKQFTFIFFVLISNAIQSQVVILPEVGFSLSQDRMRNNVSPILKNMVATQSNIIGASIMFYSTKYNFSLGICNTELTTGARFYDQSFFQRGGLQTKLTVTNKQQLISFTVSKKGKQSQPYSVTYSGGSLKIHPYLGSNHVSLSVAPEPLIGISLNHNSINLDTVGIISNSIFRFIKTETKGWNASIRVGVKLQFHRTDKGRDSFALSLIHNQGILKVLEGRLEHNSTSGLPESEGAQVFTRGTFTSLSLSYPIQILKKRSERRKKQKGGHAR